VTYSIKVAQKLFSRFQIIPKLLLHREGIYSLFLKGYEGLTLPVT